MGVQGEHRDPRGRSNSHKIKYVGIVGADVKMIVDTSGFGARSINKAAQKLKKFFSLFRPGVKCGCESASGGHVYLLISVDHAIYIRAISILHKRFKANYAIRLVIIPEIQVLDRGL